MIVQDFFAQNALYVVLLVVLIVWVGIFAFLYRIEQRVKRLEVQGRETSHQEQAK